MKSPFVYLIINLFFYAFAVNGVAQPHIKHRNKTLPPGIQSSEELETHLEEIYGFEIDLRMIHSTASVTGSHDQFEISFDDTPLYNAHVKWNRYGDDNATISYPLLDKSPGYNLTKPSSGQVIKYIKTNGRSSDMLSTGIQTIKIDDYYSNRWVIRSLKDGRLIETILDEDAGIMFENILTVYDQPDTTVWVNIYLPDPITKANVTYGDPFVDDGDNASEELIDAMTRDSIHMRWNDSSEKWELFSEYAKAVDFYHPIQDPNNPRIDPPAYAVLTADSLERNRSESEFEYFNTYYHIHKVQDHLQQLGFENLVNYPLQFDAHALNNDQSAFNGLGTASQLRFGLGGVDDAEDADVIVHEYGHAITHSASPNTNYGNERAALDEAFGDYLALSYSRRLSNFQRDDIMNWDGHNEFWDGRTLDHTRTYPSDLTNDIYLNGVMWMSALARISDSIGLDVTDRILINSTYEWFGEMKFTDASSLFLNSDLLLYNGEHSEFASVIFCERGLLATCEDSIARSIPFSEPYLGNTFDFAYNNEPLFIYPNSRKIYLIEILDIQGKLIMEQDVSEADPYFFDFEPTQLRQGVYFLRMHTDKGPFTFKITRLWF